MFTRSPSHRSSAGRVVVPFAGIALLCASLAGCSFSSNYTMSPSDFASQVADNFEKKLNVRPVVDCGTAQIDIVEGGVVHCDFSASDDPTVHYDSTTTISNVHGSDFSVDTKVDDHPKQ